MCINITKICCFSYQFQILIRAVFLEHNIICVTNYDLTACRCINTVTMYIGQQIVIASLAETTYMIRIFGMYNLDVIGNIFFA